MHPWSFARASLALATGLVASAQAIAEEPPTQTATASGVGYGGVVPGVADKPRWAAPAKAVWVTHPGFQLLPSGESRVFVQLNAEPRWRIAEQSEGQIVVEIAGARIHRKNNGRPLLTGRFPTRVRSFRAVPGPRGSVRIVIQLSQGAQPGVRTERHGDFHYLYVDLPAPSPKSTAAVLGETTGETTKVIP